MIGAQRRVARVARSQRAAPEERDDPPLAGAPLLARLSSPYTPADALAIAGHELRSPITPLKMRLQQTRRRLQREGGRERDVDDLSRALYHVERIQQQVALFLDATALMNGALSLVPRWTDLGDLARRLMETYASADAGRALRLERLEEPGERLAGFWDGPRLDVALRELVGNALKYTAGDVIIRLRRRGRMARVEVEDSGPAIPAGLRERIFEPYVTGYQSSHGLGLGLYVAREIVRLHGGRMGMRATASGGAVFWLTLPLDTW